MSDATDTLVRKPLRRIRGDLARRSDCIGAEVKALRSAVGAHGALLTGRAGGAHDPEMRAARLEAIHA